MFSAVVVPVAFRNFPYHLPFRHMTRRLVSSVMGKAHATRPPDYFDIRDTFALTAGADIADFPATTEEAGQQEIFRRHSANTRLCWPVRKRRRHLQARRQHVSAVATIIMDRNQNRRRPGKNNSALISPPARHLHPGFSPLYWLALNSPACYQHCAIRRYYFKEFTHSSFRWHAVYFCRRSCVLWSIIVLPDIFNQIFVWFSRNTTKVCLLEISGKCVIWKVSAHC